MYKLPSYVFIFNEKLANLVRDSQYTTCTKKKLKFEQEFLQLRIKLIDAINWVTDLSNIENAFQLSRMRVVAPGGSSKILICGCAFQTLTFAILLFILIYYPSIYKNKTNKKQNKKQKQNKKNTKKQKQKQTIQYINKFTKT